MPADEENKFQDEIVTLDGAEQSDVTDTDDGGAIVKMEEEVTPQEAAKFYANLAESIDSVYLTTLATRLLDDIKRDKRARKKRDDEYAEAIQRTGLGKDAPGGAEFDGASRAVHPILMEASVDFAAQAIREIFPSNGPVRIHIPGKDIDPKRFEKADRKKDYMNWQFTTQMPEFRSELDQMLPQLALGGSQYMRIVPDATKSKTRPVPQFLSSDQVSIPYAASSFYTAERQTFHENITRSEFEERIDAKIYFYPKDQITNPQMPEQTKSARAADKVEGKSEMDFYNEDGIRTVHECSLWLNLDGKLQDQGPAEGGQKSEDDGNAPYRVSLDDSTGKIVAVIRNWEEEDRDKERMQWIVEFPFVPWRGAYSVGLGQMIGSLAGAATGAMRALLDSAHVNNIPSLLRLKGFNFSGQSKEVAATGIVDVEGGAATGATDIRQIVMPIPFNEPSLVLYQLLGFCVEAAKGVVRTTFDDLSEDNKNLPVGTTLALIEQGMKVTSAIHMRLYHAMTLVIRIVHRIDKMYLTDEEIKDDTGAVLAYAKDFDGPVDCIPTADPEIFSDVQRMAQWQAITARADMAPDLYNRREVEKRWLERTKVADSDNLLKPEIRPEKMNPVNENAAMSLGRPTAAFPEQDHLAHLQVHLDFMLEPTLGQLPVIAPTMLPPMLEHIKEHVVLWYVTENYEMTKRLVQMDDDGMTMVMKERDSETRGELEKLLATESPDIIARAQEMLAALPQITAAAIEQAKQYQQPPQMPVDPNKMAEVQRKAQESKEKLADQQQERQVKTQLEFAKMSHEQRQAALDAAREAQVAANERVSKIEELLIKERGEDERLVATLSSDEKQNTQDNVVAARIAAAELEMQRRTNQSTGHGSSNNPQPR